MREPLDEITVARFFPVIERPLWRFDPKSYSRHAGNLSLQCSFWEHPNGGWTIETNELGMRESEEVLVEKPDLRILVTGDSHTDGACATSESFTNVLEALLESDTPDQTVEALNAGTGGHNLYNYLGTLERFAYLRPDVFIVAVYGGNDFSSSVIMHRYFERAGPFQTAPYRFVPEELGVKIGKLGSQEILQEVYFLNNPDDVQTAVDVACSISDQLDRLCSASGAALLFVYLPPPSRGQPAQFRAELDKVLPAAGLFDVELGVSDRIADRWLDFLDQRGLARLDLREPFRSASPRLYWRKDHHLNVTGHQLVAELLRGRVAELIEGRETGQTTQPNPNAPRD